MVLGIPIAKHQAQTEQISCSLDLADAFGFESEGEVFGSRADWPSKKCQKFVLRLRSKQWDSHGGIPVGGVRQPFCQQCQEGSQIQGS